ncbi:MAG: hypothetical protein AAF633_13820 [Chloroflexota bacterium]
MQFTLLSLTLILSYEGDLIHALELDALSRSRHPLIDKSWEYERLRQPFYERVAHLPEEVVNAARERGRQLDYWQTAETLFKDLNARGWGTANDG